MRIAPVARHFGVFVAFVVLAYASTAYAAKHRRRRIFEPTDLEMENPGVFELNLQAGAVRGGERWRTVAPDIELDFGLSRQLELDLDWAYAVEGPDSGDYGFDRNAQDNLWASVKLMLIDNRDDDAHTAFGSGLQIGPTFPVAPGTHGIGGEGVWLAAFTLGGTQLALTAGGLIDPAEEGSTTRPIAVEGGLDLDADLDAAGRFSLLANLAAVHYFVEGDDQLTLTAGIAYDPNELVELSLVGLGGLAVSSVSDRYGALLGLSWKIPTLKQTGGDASARSLRRHLL